MISDDERHEVAENLLPCPFCGGEAIGFEWSDDDDREEWEPHDEDAYCSVKVNHREDCLLEIGEFDMWVASTEEAAADAWNRRAGRTCHLIPYEVEEDTGFFDCVECDSCGFVMDVSEAAHSNFCPNCGAEVVRDGRQ